MDEEKEVEISPELMEELEKIKKDYKFSWKKDFFWSRTSKRMTVALIVVVAMCIVMAVMVNILM